MIKGVTCSKSKGLLVFLKAKNNDFLLKISISKPSGKVGGCILEI